MIKEFVNLLNKFRDKLSRDIVIGCIGRIESFDKVKMRADVLPLLEYKASGDTDSSKFAVIGDIPVLFLFAGGYYIRPDYNKGDLVWVSYATFSIESGLNNSFDDVSTGTFSRESASVVSGLAPENWEAPDFFNRPGLIMGHKNGQTAIQLTESNINVIGTINVQGNLNVTGDTVATGEVTAMSELAPVGLSTHIHSTGVGPSGPPNPNS